MLRTHEGATGVPARRVAHRARSSNSLRHVLELTTIGLLPPVLRNRFGVGWSWRRELELRALGATLRAGTPVAPAWVRNTGPDYLRWRREALARGDVASGVRADRIGARSAGGAPAPAHASSVTDSAAAR